MSILIKGMDMPSECKYCHLYELCNLNGAAFCYCKCLDGIKAIPVEGKRPDCPLIELPPHGDLIGREWLIDIALHLMNTAKNDDIANGVKWLWQYVIEAPTIIESEE